MDYETRTVTSTCKVQRERYTYPKVECDKSKRPPVSATKFESFSFTSKKNSEKLSEKI